MLLKRAIVVRGRQPTESRSGLNMQSKLDELPKSISGEKAREILRTPDGAISPFLYASRSEVTHAAYDSRDYCGASAHRKFADVAVQRGLGLLPDRRTGTDPAHPGCIGAAGSAHRLTRS
jgi:hypothetical protein